MRRVGDALSEAGVGAVYLAHGTFVGPDALGALAELARIFPSASNAVRRIIKRIVDRITGEVGNYTEGYAHTFEQAINRPGELRIPVRLFQWSSENHHIGRADGAVRLLDELASLQPESPTRILLWGHSHAGNVFALATNLLSGDQQAVERFFKATEIYYRWPIVGCVDIPIWARVHDVLLKHPERFANLDLDIVTFGTPIRYGWDSGGYRRLLHFIHHRPAEGLPEYRAPFPPKFDRILAAADGDYVQQLGIAGTNIRPNVFSWRSRLADERLDALLQSDTPGEDPLARFRAGAIVPEEGTTLLVDYGPAEGSIAQHFAGHAVYTLKRWMLFHAEEVARRFYGAA
jgi:hypothetical protein